MMERSTSRPTTSLAALDPVEPFDPIVARLGRLHPKVIDLTLDRLLRLLDVLGNPQRDLPPVFHVAGTNGKGSTVAFLRAVLEASGHRVHALTSPHLVSFTERIRLSGKLIEESRLVRLLEECEAANGEAPITFFEMAMAAATLAFSRTPADFLLLEVGLGGRYDATNIVSAPLASIITPVGIDHREFLGNTIAKIAWEKAGIVKQGCPVAASPQTAEALAVIESEAGSLSAPLSLGGRDWQVEASGGGTFRYRSRQVDWMLPVPALPGQHQLWNAGAALAALEAAGIDGIGRAEAAEGMLTVEWPARLQCLNTHGEITRMASPAGPVWLDGAHNPAAAQALAHELSTWPERPHLIAGMLRNKDYAQMLRILAPYVKGLTAVPVPRSSAGLPAEELAEAAESAGMNANSATSLPEALDGCSWDGPILIAGSLYLAGEALRLDTKPPGR